MSPQALCLPIGSGQIRNKSFGFRWHFWRVTNSLEILASSPLEEMGFPNWLNFFILQLQALQNSNHTEKGAVGKAQARGVSETIYTMWACDFQGWNERDASQITAWRSSLQRLATVMARKANKRNILSTREWNKDPTENTEVSSRAVKSTEMGAVCGRGIWFQCKHP